jgi:ParB family transcriptional regulator, chromosome partitioning protein
LRLLNLPESVKALLREEKISVGHARALLASAEPGALAEKIAAKGLSVREAENLAEAGSLAPGGKKEGAPKRKDAQEKPADTRAMEKTMMEQLGMEVQINHKKGETGDVTVRFKTFDQLELIYRRLRGD